MGTAILLGGPESSGNRLLLRFLVRNGFEDVSNSETGIDHILSERVVWLHSFPHGGNWPDVEKISTVLRNFGFSVVALIPIRDMWPTCQSQLSVPHVSSLEEAVHRIRIAHLKLFTEYHRLQIPYIPITYCSLLVHGWKVVVKSLELLHIKLDVVYEEEIVDQNAKWYQ